ncbi:hypothetical protein Hanom_Chr17g01546451 [Helianthus anomalus]
MLFFSTYKTFTSSCLRLSNIFVFVIICFIIFVISSAFSYIFLFIIKPIGLGCVDCCFTECICISF